MVQIVTSEENSIFCLSSHSFWLFRSGVFLSGQHITVVLVCFPRTTSQDEYCSIISLFELEANALLQVLLPLLQVPAVCLIMNFLGLSLLWRSALEKLFMGPAVCWVCTAGKLKRAGSWKSYRKSGFFKALYRSICQWYYLQGSRPFYA